MQKKRPIGAQMMNKTYPKSLYRIAPISAINKKAKPSSIFLMEFIPVTSFRKIKKLPKTGNSRKMYPIPTLALPKSGERSKVAPSSQPVYKLPCAFYIIIQRVHPLVKWLDRFTGLLSAKILKNAFQAPARALFVPPPMI